MEYTKIPEDELIIYSRLCDDFNTVFDVGCRDDLDYYEIKKDCEYHLFEPNTEALGLLKKKISRLDNHNIILNEFGLSNENKDDCVYYKNVESFTPHWSMASYDTGERFALKRMDDYIKDKNIKKIDFLKIDVEGLDYQVLLGGLSAIRDNNIVSYIQTENSGGARQYVKLLPNFNFYLMMGPYLLTKISTINSTDLDFNKSLIKLDDAIINFLDRNLANTGFGSNLLGVNKNINFEKVAKDKNLIFKVSDKVKKYGKFINLYFITIYRTKNLYRQLRKNLKNSLFSLNSLVKQKP